MGPLALLSEGFGTTVVMHDGIWLTPSTPYVVPTWVAAVVVEGTTT